jgi:alkanesulfonate monooxygenase SsuD/methylene tetrahydromethanopterin reductase-like flavin-dependent oxidoreductase (luciferase family)
MKVWLFLRVGYPKRIPGSYLLAGKDYDRLLGKEIYDEVVEFLRGIEDYGFDGVFFPEHHSRAANGLSPSPNLFVAMTAVLTKRMKIGLMGNCLPLHHPVRLGEELAVLDNISNGRLVVGMTRGGDFWAFNIASEESRERFEEGWDIIAKGWQAEEPFEYHGKYWDLDYVAFLPRPLQKPFPETWIPSISAESIEWAAKNHICLAASWSPTSQIKESFAYYRQYAEEHCGWAPGADHCIVSRDVYVAETNAKARAEAEANLLVGPAEEFGGAPKKYGRSVADKYFSERATSYKKTQHVGVMEIKNWSFEKLNEEGIAIVGDPDYVTEQLIHQCRALGTERIMMRPVFGRLRLPEVKNSIKLMAEEVVPNLAKESVVVPGRASGVSA